MSQVAGNFHFAPGKSFQQSHVHGKNLFFHTCVFLSGYKEGFSKLNHLALCWNLFNIKTRLW